MRKLGYAAVMAVLAVAALATDAMASQVSPPVSVPEISPGSVSAGLALIAGGVMLARARWRR